MTAEGNETPGSDSPQRSEGDLLAERRARRAAETGETALTRRAQAAEATVETLETHVASLQQRLREAEEERLRLAALVETERVSAVKQVSVVEHELRRIEQREYAEQQLRVEAEERCVDLERDSRAEIDRLSRRLSASESAARELAGRLESVRRELAEAEHDVAAERAMVRRSEQDLQARLTELERRALEIHRGLDAERAARERSERLLETMRSGHRTVEGLVAELKGVVARLIVVFGAEAPPPRGEMADALAAASERLRARVQEIPAASSEPVALPPESPPASSKPVGKPVEAPSPDADTAAEEAARAVAGRPAHKHSMSLIGRLRLRRKQRRSG